MLGTARRLTITKDHHCCWRQRSPS
jgi:hypothetical protein